MSLKGWQARGMLSRELALYARLRPHLAGVTIVSYGGGADQEIAAAYRGVELLCNRWGLPPGLFRRVLPRLVAKACRGPRLYKSNQIHGADVAMRLAHRHGVPFVARCGFLLSDFCARAHGNGSRPHREAIRLERSTFRGAEHCIVTTEAMREQVLAYGVVAERVSVIPNYVDTTLFTPARMRPAQAPRVLFIGRLSAQKNPLVLLRALENLGVVLDIVGQGELRGQLEREARDRGVSVTFHGAVAHDRLPEILRRASIYVLPSLYEGHPKTLLEAMACATPLIGTNVSGIREVVQDGRTGLLCPPTAEAMRAAILRLLADEGLRSTLGVNARETAVSRFSLDRIVASELAVYAAASDNFNRWEIRRA